MLNLQVLLSRIGFGFTHLEMSDSILHGCFTTPSGELVTASTLSQVLLSRTFASQVFTEISTHQDYSIVGLILKQVFTEISTHQDSSIVGLIFPHKP